MTCVFAETVDKNLVPLQILIYFPLTLAAPLNNTEYCRRTQVQFIIARQHRKNNPKVAVVLQDSNLPVEINSSDFD